MILYSTGIFSALLTFLLKFCPIDVGNKETLLKSACETLQNMSRGNDRVNSLNSLHICKNYDHYFRSKRRFFIILEAF